MTWVCISKKVGLTVTNAEWEFLESVDKDGSEPFKDLPIEDVDWSGHFGQILFFTIEEGEFDNMNSIVSSLRNIMEGG